MIIQHNMLAMNANRQNKINNHKTGKLSEKLSSGYRINRAADDAAGLAISEKLRRIIRGLNQASENVQEGIGYVQTADGALNEVHDILQRMNELAVKSANGTNTEEDRQYIDSEVQHLKEELDRIFENTTFNERKIWEPTTQKQIDTVKKQALEFKDNTRNIDVTNDNCGVIAMNGYKFLADDDGVSINWTGYDGQTYQTKKIDWDTLEANDYKFNMEDYFDPDDPSQAALFDANGNPVFTHTISFTKEEVATVDDMITCINNVTMSSGSSARISGRFETSDGTAQSKSGVSLNSTYINYTAAYASNTNKGSDATAATNGTQDVYNFDAADDDFLKPADSTGTPLTNGSTGGNITQIPSADSEGWEMTFYMDGIGKVTATSTSVGYYSNNRADEDEGLWWSWVKRSDGTRYKSAIGRSVSGTLGGIKDALNGTADTSSPGILDDDKGGAGDDGGTIQLHFSLTSETPYEYGDNNSSDSIGSFTLSISVGANDTQQDVLDRISNALSPDSIFDIYTTGSSSDGHTLYTPQEKTHMIDTPIWGGTCSIIIQAGNESPDDIEIQYDSLSVIALGLKNTNVSTPDDCDEAIESIKSAMHIVNKQRADFGAYQNRLEHTYNNNKNVEENTQFAESAIRDTDMASTMVEYANQNILLQVNQSMLTQTNSNRQAILQLLQ